MSRPDPSTKRPQYMSAVQSSCFLCFFTCLLITGFPVTVVSQDDSDVPSENYPRTQINEEAADRLYNEAPEAWARVRERMNSHRGSYSKSLDRSKSSGERQPSRVDFAVDGENMKATFQEDGVEFVFATNRQYAFVISKRLGDAHSTYTIQLLEQRGQNPEIEAHIEMHALEYCQYANSAWRFRGKLFSDWFDEPGFTVHGIDYENIDGKKLIRVDYSYVPSASTETDDQEVPAAYHLYDPENDWVLRESGIYMPWGVQRGVCEYHDPVDGFPMLASSKSVIEGNDGSMMEYGIVMHELTDEPTPAEEFRLSFYGLPEPNFERVWYGSWLMYVLAGAVCLAIAHVIRRRRAAA